MKTQTRRPLLPSRLARLAGRADRRRLIRAAPLAVTAALMVSPAALARWQGATTADGPAYPVSELVLRYLHEDHPGHPPLEEIMALEVELGDTIQGYVAPRAGVPSVSFRLADVAHQPLVRFYASAIQRILERIRDHLSEIQLLAVYVAPDPLDINEVGQDLRPPGRTALRLVITTGVTSEVRTLAAGKRFDPADRINNPAHQRIIDRSPATPYVPGDPERRDLLHKDLLDNYIFRLSRHPGRRVDVALSGADQIGGVILDYHVTENRPLVLYAQISNTGTADTDRWRERFGLIHSQLTDQDDILSLEYITTAFDEVNASIGSYEAPLGDSDTLRWRVHGSWSEYTASEVGFFGSAFSGESWSAGGEIIANIYQRENLFVDLVGGARFDHIDVDNSLTGVTGKEDFFLPHVGLRLEQRTEWYSTLVAAAVEWTHSDITGVDQAELDNLGRPVPDDDWVVLRWDVSESFYLEPLLDPTGWADPTTPETSTLAHEIALSFRGQYAFGHRLIPQQEQVVGGLYTVRGYPESVVAGDTVLIGSVEYRFHLPRALEIQPTPPKLFGRPFRVAPQNVYGRPDWDLILRGFFDVGRTFISDQIFTETEDTLVGAGVGLELQLTRNFNLRADWGFALNDLATQNVHAGSNRFHIVATLLY